MLKILKKKPPPYKDDIGAIASLMQLLGEARAVRETCLIALRLIHENIAFPAEEACTEAAKEKNVALYLKLTPMLIKLQEHEVALLREQQYAEGNNKLAGVNRAVNEMPLTAADKFILEAVLKDWDAAEEGKERVED